MSEFAPPPRHISTTTRRDPRPAQSSSSSSTPEPPSSTETKKETWKAWSKRKGSGWGSKAVVKGVAVSDNWGGKINSWTQAIGSESFWPVTGDFPAEMEKCARILRAFTVVGVERKVTEKEVTGIKRQRTVLRKIPAHIIKEARGLAIFTSMRSGIAPLAGAGGAGVVVAKLPDGTWSPPSAILPYNMSAGLMFGVDVYDAVLIIRSEKALASFYSHKATLGAELGLTAGPYGTGAAVEGGVERSAVLSYIRARGLYAGVEVVGQVFFTRTEENETTYYWPGVKPIDILSGKVKMPAEAASLQAALHDAESGAAQAQNPNEDDGIVDISSVELEDGEVLRLPPTPSQLAREDEESKYALLDEPYLPLPPPKHKGSFKGKEGMKQEEDEEEQVPVPVEKETEREEPEVKEAEMEEIMIERKEDDEETEERAKGH